MSTIISFEKNDFVNSIAKQLGLGVIIPQVTQFSDGEIDITFDENQVKNKRVFLLHNLKENNNELIMWLLLLIYKIKYAQAQEIIGVIPYFPYSRQAEGSSSNAHAIIDILEHAGITQFVCVELHDQSMQSLFTVPLHQVFLDNCIAHHIQSHVLEDDYCIVAPDEGARARVNKIATHLNKKTILYNKKRIGEHIKLLSSQGNCISKTAIIIDDIIDTGDTAYEVAKDLRAQGIKKIYGYFIHPVFALPPAEIIKKLKFERIFVSNSINHEYETGLNIEQFDCSGELIPILKSLNL